MAMTAQSALVTAEDYRLLPETGPRYQLIEGELYRAPAPRRWHQDILRDLAFVLQEYVQKNPIGKLYFAPLDVYLTEHNVYQPDLLFVANERLHLLTEEGMAGAPNFVVEVLSDTTARLDRNMKRKVYAATGVEELWLVDPPARTIEVFRLQADLERPAAIYQAADTFTSPCFPGLRFNAAEIFKG